MGYDRKGRGIDSRFAYDSYFTGRDSAVGEPRGRQTAEDGWQADLQVIFTAARYRTAALTFLASLIIGVPYSSKVDKRRLAEDHKILRTLQTRTADASLEGSHGSVSTVT